MTNQQPPRLSGSPVGRPVPGADWATQAPTRPLSASAQHASQQPQHAYPAQPYVPQHRPTAQRVRERDAARARVGGVTAVVAVAALLGTGAAVVAATGLGSSSTTASTTTTTTSDDSGSSSSSSSDSSGTTVSSSNQSGVASTSGS